ncbi:MAG: DUF1294 domain-containing protein [Tissierella sp.]|nr:DUF1294 domain-containing protein [Tissierella sp.]
MNYLSYYFVAINVINFFLFTIDKQKAKRKQWRIPESLLFLTSLVGGSLGGILSMNIMKHKTRKTSFKVGMPILMIVNFLCYLYLSKLL